MDFYAKRRKAAQAAPLYAFDFLVCFLRNNFFSVVIAAISANSMRYLQVMAVRALHHRRGGCLV